MSGNDPTHELLTEVGSHVRSQPPVVADVMAQVAKEPSRRPGRRRRWIVGGIPAGLAACLALVVGVWHVATTPAKGLHERAMSALADVRSAHVVDRRHVDGTWRVNTELWYVRGMGVREEVHYEEATRVRVDDGRTQWRYWSGDTDVIGHRPSVDPVGSLVMLLDVDALRKVARGEARRPDADEAIDGDRCRAYFVSPASGWEDRYWVGPSHRIRRTERWVQEADGTWRPAHRTEAVYDGPVDAAILRFEAPADARLVDLAVPADPDWARKTAAASQASAGLRYTVHQLTPIEGGMFLLRCSATRNGQEFSDLIRRPLPPEFRPGPGLPVLANVGAWSPPVAGRAHVQYAAGMIGQYREWDGYAEWLLLVPKNRPPAKVDTIMLRVFLRSTRPSPGRGPVSVTLQAQPAGPEVPLAQAMQDAFDTLRRMDLLAKMDHQTLLYVFDPTGARPVSRGRNAHQVRFQDLLRSAQLYIQMAQ